MVITAPRKVTHQLAANIQRSGEIGRLVAPDFKSSMLVVPLLDRDPQTNKPLNYGQLSRAVEAVRAKYESPSIGIHIVGFAKVVGDLIEGLEQFELFFAVSLVIAMAGVYWYTRCIRSTLVVMVCSSMAVIWLLGLLPLMKFGLDPYTILVPFLIFAIGKSHGAQKMNGIMRDVGRGAHKLAAARLTFRRLFVAGVTALGSDAVGFAVLLLIDIQAIRHLAIIASLGVALLIFTNLILLPVLLSYIGVSHTAAERSMRNDIAADKGDFVYRRLVVFPRPAWAASAIGVAALIGAVAWQI